MKATLLNTALMILGAGMAVIARFWTPDVPEVAMVGTFLVGLGIRRFGDKPAEVSGA